MDVEPRRGASSRPLRPSVFVASVVETIEAPTFANCRSVSARGCGKMTHWPATSGMTCKDETSYVRWKGAATVRSMLQQACQDVIQIPVQSTGLHQTPRLRTRTEGGG